MRIFQFSCWLLFWATYSVTAQQTVVAYGDSITRGWPYYQNIGSGERNGGYVPGLEAQLNAANWNVLVRNWGYPAQLISDIAGPSSGQSRINYVLGQSNPHYVVLMEGTNDLPFGLSPGTIINAIGHVVDDIQAFGAEPLVGTLLPRFDGNFAIASTNNLIRSLSADENIGLVDFYSAASLATWFSLMPDHLHPNLAGYSLMADTAFQSFSDIRKTPSITGAIYLLLLDS